jgi:excisionase family DNA binding protein
MRVGVKNKRGVQALTIAQVAARLGTSRATVSEWIKNKQLHCDVLSAARGEGKYKSRRIWEEDLDEFIATFESEATPAPQQAEPPPEKVMLLPKGQGARKDSLGGLQDAA